MDQDTAGADEVSGAEASGQDSSAEASGLDVSARLLREAVSAVYAVPPAEFVTVRTAWVKRLRGEGSREVATEVAALRKPSAAAGVVNALVRAEDPVITMLREVGTRLRHAQSTMDSAALAGLRSERDRLLSAWVSAAHAHAQRPITAGVEAEIRDTAVAALADAEATDIVLSGSLTRALSYSGFGEVDVADAVARTRTGVVLTRIDGGGERSEPDPRAELAARAGAAESAVREAEQTFADAEQTVSDAEAELERARARVQDAAEALARARAGWEEAKAALQAIEPDP